ncbi:hypothetical protein G6O69_12925 [Pseudenhygromyxa sp. WMMC2535]|uniref:HvfC family peptide modification chaperone n=1 Tax=Pseudenhygromyxa sp. WMMC2535 TaxID=2712867 RepID=UPI001554D608|nr:hypothetical protein [Pseudenhygromyxa sp. WMMC2535]NVB38736.1 hypothetical protein [Pseudenhygromyxa sp. WMMC2535]
MPVDAPAPLDSSTPPEQLLVALGRVIREPELRARVERDPEGTLEELGLDEGARVGMLGYGVERLLAYQHMVHSRLLRAVRGFIGPAAKVIGEARLREEVGAWIEASGSHSPYLREVPEEFLAWACPRWAEDESLPPWLGALAAHAVLERSLRNDPRPVGEPTGVGLDLERPMVCNPTATLRRYDWAVHRFPREPAADAAPQARAVRLVGYRDLDERVRFHELPPRAAALLDGLLAQKTLRDALFAACEQTGESLNDEILGQTALAIAELIDIHVLHGGA